MKVSFRTIFWIGAALVLAGVLAVTFRPQPALVDLTTVTRGSLTVSVRDEGRTRVRDTYVVSAPLGGRVLRVGNRIGEQVEAGDVVASILPSEPGFLDERARREAEANAKMAEQALAFARAERDRADAAVAHAQLELKRDEALRAEDAVAQSEFERRRLDLRTATAELNSARARVGMREAELRAAKIRLMEPGRPGSANAGMVELKAPVSGRILRVLQQSESPVTLGTPILEIGDVGDLEVVAELLSSDAVQVRLGAEARIDAWGSGTPLRGRVRLIEPSGFAKVSALGVEEQRVNVILDVLETKEEWPALGDGYRVEVAITVWEGEDVVQAPVGALFRQGGAWAVFREDNGRARLTSVEVGRHDGRRAHILAGLEPGQQVILYPGRSIVDGTRIRQRDVAAP